MTTAAPKASNDKGTNNGNGHAADPLAQAIAYEQAIADEAGVIREDATELTHELYMKLLPLLRKPIPQGFIKTTGATDGKPYPSTGIKSVQVQMDRMDNVLTPAWWEITDSYEQDGKLCRATVFVILADREAPITRASWGGMNRGSTIGNLYKGSFTNAAKRALAMVGPGHEVYLGATDYDPDVAEDAAAEQTKADPAPKLARIEGDRVAELLERAKEWVGDTQDTEEQKARNRRLATALGSVGGAGKRISERIASLTPKQADEFEQLLTAEIGGEAK